MFSRFEFPWVSPHLDLWHSVCNKPASLLFVQKMFCNVSYFHFSPHKENFMWGSYFTFIFLFPRHSFALPDKTHNYILSNIVGKRRKTIFSFSKRGLALYSWFPGSSVFSFLNVRQNLPSLLFGDLEEIFSFSVCLFKFVLDEESKILKSTQGCFFVGAQTRRSGSRMSLKHFHTFTLKYFIWTFTFTISKITFTFTISKTTVTFTMSVLHFQKVGSSCLFELKRENQDQGCLWNTFTQVPQGFTFPMQFIPELEKMKKRQFAHQMVFMAENNNTSFKLFNSYFENKSTNE